MRQEPFRRCDYCNTRHRTSHPWTLHNNTRKLTCSNCSARGKADDLQAAAIIARNIELFRLRLLAEPSDTYGDPVHRQYAEIKAKYPDALVLLRDGDQYFSIAEDAELMQRVLGLQPIRVFAGEEPVLLARFPEHALDVYLPALVRAGNRVALCDPYISSEAAEPFGDAPLPHTHTVVFQGQPEEVRMYLNGGRYYSLDSTWDVATTDPAIRKVNLASRSHTPALYGIEHDDAMAAEPASRYERIERRLTEERLGTLITVLRRHDALPDPRVTDRYERLREDERAARALFQNMPAIRAELKLHHVWLCRHGYLHFRLVRTKVNMNPAMLPQLLADYKRMFARTGMKGGSAPARSIGNFTTDEQAARTVAHAEENLRTAQQYTWIVPELAKHYRKHLADVQERLSQPHQAA